MCSIPTLCFIIDDFNELAPLVKDVQLHFINVITIYKKLIVLAIAIG